MSQTSPLETIGGPRKGGEGTGWTLLRHGWPALLLALGIVVGTLLEPPGGDGVVDQSIYGLSAEALAEGRWWTLVSHAFLPTPVWLSMVVGAVFLVIALTSTLSANPGWMGGWKTPTVFMTCAGFGALAQLSLSPATTLSGPWSGALGLLAYHLVARRSRSLAPESAQVPDTDEARKDQAERWAWHWINTWLQVLVGFPLLDLYPSPLPGDIAARFILAAVIVLGGAGLVYAGTILGGSIKLRILCVVRRGLLWIWGLAIAVAGAGWLAEHWLSVLELPWPAYAAGVLLGLALGLFERRRLRAH